MIDYENINLTELNNTINELDKQWKEKSKLSAKNLNEGKFNDAAIEAHNMDYILKKIEYLQGIRYICNKRQLADAKR